MVKPPIPWYPPEPRLCPRGRNLVLTLYELWTEHNSYSLSCVVVTQDIFLILGQFVSLVPPGTIWRSLHTPGTVSAIDGFFRTSQIAPNIFQSDLTTGFVRQFDYPVAIRIMYMVMKRLILRPSN